MNESEGLRFRRQHRPQVLTDELHEHRYKGPGTYSGKVFQVTLLALGGFLLLPLLVFVLILESPIQPDAFTLKEPPQMKGCWEPNLKLREAQRLFEDQILGPESIANIGDVLFSGTADGKIVKLIGRRIHTVTRLGKLPCGSPDEESSCGRPLGIRVGPNGTLIVADAYLGLFEVNPTTGETTTLVSGGQIVAGRKLSFINDVAVTQDGKKVYFTDSSSRWQRRDYLHLIMEATADGRVLELDTESGEVTVLMDNLRFPNGIQLLPDEESVLVAETTMARIRRVHVAGLNKGGMDTFMDNLPGFPDNIRPSSSGGYWVAMAAVRPNPGFSMLDFLSQRPWIKKLIFKIKSGVVHSSVQLQSHEQKTRTMKIQLLLLLLLPLLSAQQFSIQCYGEDFLMVNNMLLDCSGAVKQACYTRVNGEKGCTQLENCQRAGWTCCYNSRCNA